ncbi:MOS1T transposase, partial [Pseudoatta argentina]
DTTCRDWFRRFKNNDFQLEDKERSGAPKKFQDKELEQLLDEDPSQTLRNYPEARTLGTITGDHYRLQLMRLSRALKEKRPLYAQRHDKVILLHDNARPHVAKPVKTYIAPSDFHLFKSYTLKIQQVLLDRATLQRACERFRPKIEAIIQANGGCIE